MHAVKHSHSWLNAHWIMRAADHDVRHRVAEKEKGRQKIDWYSLLVYFSPELHRKYPLAPKKTQKTNKQTNKQKKLTGIEVQWSQGQGEQQLKRRQRGFLIQTSMLLYQNFNWNYHHCTRETFSDSDFCVSYHRALLPQRAQALLMHFLGSTTTFLDYQVGPC